MHCTDDYSLAHSLGSIELYSHAHGRRALLIERSTISLQGPFVLHRRESVASLASSLRGKRSDFHAFLILFNDSTVESFH